MEVYVDDIVVKSKKVEDHPTHFERVLNKVRKHNIRDQTIIGTKLCIITSHNQVVTRKNLYIVIIRDQAIIKSKSWTITI